MVMSKPGVSFCFTDFNFCKCPLTMQEPLTSSIEAAIAAGKEGESLLIVNQNLAAKISDYKKAAGHCKKHAPSKGKPKASAKSAATPPEP